MLDDHRKTTCRDAVIGAFRRAGIRAEWDPKGKTLIAKISRERVAIPVSVTRNLVRLGFACGTKRQVS
jgi:hypothetical protein